MACLCGFSQTKLIKKVNRANIVYNIKSVFKQIKVKDQTNKMSTLKVKKPQS